MSRRYSSWDGRKWARNGDSQMLSELHLGEEDEDLNAARWAILAELGDHPARVLTKGEMLALEALDEIRRSF